MSHVTKQADPLNANEQVMMNSFTDRLADWIRAQPDVRDFVNIDGSVMGWTLDRVGDVSLSVTPTGHV